VLDEYRPESAPCQPQADPQSGAPYIGWPAWRPGGTPRLTPGHDRLYPPSLDRPRVLGVRLGAVDGVTSTRQFCGRAARCRKARPTSSVPIVNSPASIGTATPSTRAPGAEISEWVDEILADLKRLDIVSFALCARAGSLHVVRVPPAARRLAIGKRSSGNRQGCLADCGRSHTLGRLKAPGPSRLTAGRWDRRRRSGRGHPQVRAGATALWCPMWARSRRRRQERRRLDRRILSTGCWRHSGPLRAAGDRPVTSTAGWAPNLASAAVSQSGRPRSEGPDFTRRHDRRPPMSSGPAAARTLRCASGSTGARRPRPS
jgi:hypothetical protein